MNEAALQEKVDSLSEDQKTIYSHLVKGRSIKEIAEVLGRPESIIAAQKTRILNKGIDLPETVSDRQSVPPPQKPQVHSRPRATGPSSNEEVLRQAQEAGQAEYDVEKIIEEVRKQSGDNINVRDVHPMVMLGVAIQFMKLAGGRMHAHQLIEDVYGALQMLVNGNRMRDVPGVTTETKPWPPQKTEDSGIKGADNTIIQMLSEQQRQISQLAEKLRRDDY